MRASLVAVSMCAAQLAWASSAAAGPYICTRVADSSGRESGSSLSWLDRDLEFTFHAQGTNDLTNEFELVRASFAAWGKLFEGGSFVGSPPQECTSPNRATDLTFTEQEPRSIRDSIGWDYLTPSVNENLIIFRDTGWQIPGQAGSIIGLTTTTYNALTGEIFDADIEFNSANFQFRDLRGCCPDCDKTDGDPVDVECQFTDLMNTTVHEIGHYLGLHHNCGEQYPSCKVADAGITMNPTASLGEVVKRDLACGDRDGIVFKYPAGEDNGSCAAADASCGYCAPPRLVSKSVAIAERPPGSVGCAAVVDPLVGLGAAAALVFATLLRIFRSRRRTNP